MATKTIVRYKPPNEIVGGRELTIQDMEAVGIFTQKRNLFWAREKGFWLDAEEAGISAETLAWLKDPANGDDRQGHWTVEEQHVEDEPSPEPAEVTTRTSGRSGADKNPK